MSKTLIIIEDKDEVATSIEMFFKMKKFNTIRIDSAEITESEIKSILSGVEGEVVVVSDYNDEVTGASFSKVAAEVVKVLRQSNIKPFFVANSANTNTDLIKEISVVLGEDFKADYSEIGKLAKPIFDKYMENREMQENKVLA